jgi:hypothetical protein
MNGGILTRIIGERGGGDVGKRRSFRAVQILVITFLTNCELNTISMLLTL